MSNDLDSLFASYDEAAAAKDVAAAQRGSGARHVTLSKLDPGTVVYRIAPAKPDRRSPLVIRGTHFLKALSKTDKTLAIPCVATQFSRPCEVCAAVKALQEAAVDNPAFAEIAKDCESTFSFVFAALDTAIPLDPDALADSFVIVEGKRTVFNGLTSMRNNPREGDFSHPLQGFGVQITKKGSGMNTEYAVAVDALGGGRGAMVRRADGSPDVEMIRKVLTEAPDPWTEISEPTEEQLDAARAYFENIGVGATATRTTSVAGNLGVPGAKARR